MGMRGHDGGHDMMWHDDDGYPRYESIIENAPGQQGHPISYLFPPFDPNDDQYDTYNFVADDDDDDDDDDVEFEADFETSDDED